MTKTINAAIIDDHKIVREGLKAMLLGLSDIRIIAEGGNETDLLEILKNNKPDLIIMDLSMPGKSGVELCGFVSNKYPEIKVLILTSCNDEENIIASIEAGAGGFLHKDCSLAELESAIKMVYCGEGYFSENITGIIYKSYISRLQNENTSINKNNTLSEREIEVIKLFSNGMSYKEIANILKVSVKTIESHKNNILRKLNLNNTIELVKYAIKKRIINI